MSAAVINAKKTSKFIDFDICPYFEDNCDCVDPQETHRHFTFVNQPPTWENAHGRKMEFKGDWVEHCMEEALRIVEADNTEDGAEHLEHLVGRKLK